MGVCRLSVPDDRDWAMAGKLKQMSPAQRLKAFIAGEKVVTGHLVWTFNGQDWTGKSTTNPFSMTLRDDRLDKWLTRHGLIEEETGVIYDSAGHRKASQTKKGEQENGKQ